MNSIAAISQCFSQLRNIFPQICSIMNQLVCYFLGGKYARITCVLQISVDFDEIRFRSISSRVFFEGCYITTGKALKSDFEKYSVSTLYILNGWMIWKDFHLIATSIAHTCVNFSRFEKFRWRDKVAWKMARLLMQRRGMSRIVTSFAH